jgi:ribonuclease E
MKKEMLINVLQPEECRIAIVEDGVLEELYVERTSHESYVGNIYKGRIVNIEPSIQAAFVDFGVGRNGFLHVSDVEPQYYKKKTEAAEESGGRRSGRHRGRSTDLPEPPDPDLSTLRDDTFDEEEDDEPPARERKGEDSPASPAEAAPTEASQDEPARSGSRRRSGDRAAGEPRSRSDEAAEPRAGTDTPGETESVRESTAAAHEAKKSSSRAAPGDSLPRMPAAERVTEADDGGDASSAAAAGSVSGAEAESSEEADELLEQPAADTTAGSSLTPESSAGEVDQAEDDSDEELHARELEVMEMPMEEEESDRSRSRGRRGRPRRGMRGNGLGKPKPPIQEIFRRGQEVLVQVSKEGIGTKGPTLTTYISIPGRYLVLMPGLNRIGVSRKIVDDEQRKRLREVLGELQPPKGLGFIIRTAGLDRNKKELQRDLAYLARLWKVVVGRIKKTKAPASIYQESDMITRTIRDIFTSEIETIWVDEPKAYEHAKEFLDIVMPRYAARIKLYTDSEPLFHKYRIEEEITRIQRRHVPLRHGGSIVIDQTEALVAIDVNSGSFRADNNAEETAYQMNMLAAKEIARQLRLRDLGGVIVNDFIDMREERHRRDVERALREAVKRDRARTKILKISAFGIIEMTRQRIRPSLKRSIFEDCPACRGSGQVKTCESMSIDVMRLLQLAAHHAKIARVDIRVTGAVAHYLLNKKRQEISQLEETGEMQVTIESDSHAPPEALDFVCCDSNGGEIKLLPGEVERGR